LSQERFLDEETLEHLRRYLPVWSAVQSNRNANRGIPQGCLASDLLANIYLLQFDQGLAVQEFHYLRYVDDIRLLGRSKEAVQKGLIQVDLALKSIGLLLQTQKTIVRPRSDDLQEEVDRLAAQLSEIDSRFRNPEHYIDALWADDPLIEVPTNELALITSEDDIETGNSRAVTDSQQEDELFAKLIEWVETEVQEQLKVLFWESLSDVKNRSENLFAERHLRFALYRLNPEPDITEAIIPLFLDRPWLSEVIAFYLSKDELEEGIIQFLQKVIYEHDVYDSVVALAVKLLIRQGVSLRRYQNLFRRWITDEKRRWTLLEAASQALGESDDNMSLLLRGCSATSPLVRRMCLIQALRLASNRDEAIFVASNFVEDVSIEVSNTLIYLIYNEWDWTLSEVTMGRHNIPEQTVRYAGGYDKTLPTMEADYIRHTMVSIYDVSMEGGVDFRKFLGTEYHHATKFLWQAQISYRSNPSRYVSQLDLFHEELLYPILVDWVKLKPSRDDLAIVEFSNRIDMLVKNKRELRTFAGAISACRDLRANPETHSRFHRQLTYTNEVTWRERDNLKRQLCGGYQELVSWIAKGCP
jgi:hypothetical protein